MSQTKAQLLDNIKDNVQLDARNSLRFADTDSSHYVAFKAPATVSSNVTWTLPAADGSANYVLATDGSGNLSWIADPAGQWVTSGSNIYFTGGNVGIGDSSPSNPLSVTGVSAFNGDVTFTGASYNATWDKSADSLIFNDNAKAYWGTDSDLRIQHTGTHGYIDNETGNLYIRNDGANDDSNIYIQAKDGEESIICHDDGEVQLYFDGNEKLNTVTDGINLTGSLQFADDANTHLSRAAADTLVITTAGSERLRVDASGRVGIGTTNPQVEFHIADASPIFRIQDTTNNFYAHISADDAGNLVLDGDAGDGSGGSAVIIKTDGSERARFTVDGQLLIGHTSSQSVYSTSALQIQGTSAPTSSLSLLRQNGSPYLSLGATGGGTKGGADAVSSGDRLGQVTFAGADGTDVNTHACSIAGYCDGSVSSNVVPGRLVFKTSSGAGEPERMRIDSSGRILIADAGTAGNTPMETFGSAVLQIATTAGASIVLGRNDTSVAVDNNIGGLYWDCNDSTSNAWNDVARISCISDGTHADGDYPTSLEFYTTADNEATVTQRMVIKNGGSVGIGTSGPENRLHVVSTNYQTARFESSATDANGAYVEIYANSSSPADNDIAGILSFKGKNSAAEETTYAQIRAYLDDVTNGTEDGSLTFHTRDEGSFAQRMRLTSSGKLGLGTTAPENLLHINTSGASGNGITMKSTDSFYPRIVSDANRDTADNYLLHIDGRWNGTSVAQIVLETGADTTNKDDGRITFRTAAAGTTTERMRIDNTGKVGINTGEGSAPADWLHVNTTNSNNTGITLKTTANGYSTITGDANRTAIDNYLLKIGGAWNGNEVTMITMESGNDTTNKDDGQINFWTQNASAGGLTERLSIEPDGNVRVRTGNLEISTSGQGIDFSATAGPSTGTGTSELFDDYEEGTLTWQLRKSGSTSTGSDNGSNVKYTKVGRLVHISGRIRTDSTPGDGDEYFYLDGTLPFTPVTSGTAVIGHLRSQDQTDSSLTASVSWLGSSSTIYIYTLDSKADYSGTSNNTPASTQTNLVATFSLTYQAS